MKKIKLLDTLAFKLFLQHYGIKNQRIFNWEQDPLWILLNARTNTNKTDILELFEYEILEMLEIGFARTESGELFWNTYDFENIWGKNPSVKTNTPTPTYISEYIGVIGQLFLGDMIDFGSECDWDNKDEIDYPTNLSHWGNSKYEAWIYFRDNFFYKNAFMKTDEDDIIDEQGYSTMYGDTSWDTPQYWSQYNIWVCLTPKGKKYLNETLAPKFYEKYKDIEVEIDKSGNIISWSSNSFK